VFSLVLTCVCYKRQDSPKEDIEHHYHKFHFELNANFKARAGIEEITIDTDKKETEQTRDEILKHLNEVTTQHSTG
jgi:hypothetical protein